MRLTKITPSVPVPVAFGSFRNELDRMMNQLLYPGEFATGSRLSEAMWSPSLDFSETDKDFVVRLEAPGMTKDELEVNLDGQVLTLSGQRTTSKEGKDEQYFWREREEGRFLRSLQLPSAVDGGKVDAKIENGVITVKLPKTQPTVSTKIPIK